MNNRNFFSLTFMSIMAILQLGMSFNVGTISSSPGAKASQILTSSPFTSPTTTATSILTSTATFFSPVTNSMPFTSSNSHTISPTNTKKISSSSSMATPLFAPDHHHLKQAFSTTSAPKSTQLHAAAFLDDSEEISNSSNNNKPLVKEGSWGAYLDNEQTGLIYYFNAITGESTWDKPSATFPDVPKESWYSDNVKLLQSKYLQEYKAIQKQQYQFKTLKGIGMVKDLAEKMEQDSEALIKDAMTLLDTSSTPRTTSPTTAFLSTLSPKPVSTISTQQVQQLATVSTISPQQVQQSATVSTISPQQEVQPSQSQSRKVDIGFGGVLKSLQRTFTNKKTPIESILERKEYKHDFAAAATAVTTDPSLLDTTTTTSSATTNKKTPIQIIREKEHQQNIQATLQSPKMEVMENIEKSKVFLSGIISGGIAAAPIVALQDIILPFSLSPYSFDKFQMDTTLTSLECGLFAMILRLFLREDDRGGENDLFKNGIVFASALMRTTSLVTDDYLSSWDSIQHVTLGGIESFAMFSAVAATFDFGCKNGFLSRMK